MKLPSSSCFIALAVAIACGDDRTGDSAGDAPAGAVVEVQGRVTATRAAAGSAKRELMSGADVYADDTVATADDASVTIELAHNTARWSLTGGVSRRVDESPAWRAQKGSGEGAAAATERDRTAAAGRHAERSAIDRAIEPSAVAAAPEPIPPPPPPAAAPPPPPELKRKPRRRRAKSKEKRKPGPPDESDVSGLLDDEAPSRLSRSQVRAGLTKVMGKIKRCGPKHDAEGIAVSVDIVIAPRGNVDSAKARGKHAGTPVGQCVERAVKSARFPRVEGETRVRYPFRL